MKGGPDFQQPGRSNCTMFESRVLVQSRAAEWELRFRLRHNIVTSAWFYSKPTVRVNRGQKFIGNGDQHDPNLPTALILSFSLSAGWSQRSSRHSNVEPRRVASSVLSSTRSNKSLLSGWKPSNSSGQEKSCDSEACR